MSKPTYDNPRPAIPAAVARIVLVEAGHACSVKDCREHTYLELHHIDENRENNEPDNLIVLCDKHHKMAHAGKIDRKALKLYKDMLKASRDASIVLASTQNRHEPDDRRPQDPSGEVPFQAPPLPTHHVARPELADAIVNALGMNDNASGALPQVALVGGGGVGKTTLGAMVAHHPKIQERFPDGVLWTELGQAPQIEAKLSAWADAIAGGGGGSLSSEANTGLLRTALHRRALLVVVDNVWEVEHLRPLLIGGSRCALLFTTRRAHIADLVGAISIPVAELDLDQALAMVERRAPRMAWSDALRKEVARLAADVDYNALAVELIGGMLNRGISLAEVDRSMAANARSKARRSLEACLEISLAYIREEDPQTWERFLLLTLSPPDALLSPAGCATLWNTAPDDAEQTLLQLADDALVTRLDQRFRVHDLLREVARPQIAASVPEGLGTTAAAIHGEIVRRYMRQVPDGRWDLVKPDDYVHAHLFWHIVEARDTAAASDILFATTPDDRLAWFVACDAIGQRGTYEADVRASLRLFAREEGGGMAGQLLCALIIASLRSSLTNLKPEIFEALVAHGGWSALASFFGITQALSQASVKGHDFDLLVAFARGIDRRGDGDPSGHELGQRLREQALTICQDSLAPPSTSAVELRRWGRLIPLLSSENAAALARDVMDACETANDRIDLLPQLPIGMQSAYRAAILADVDKATSAGEGARQLARLFERLTPEERAERAPQLEALLYAHVNELVGQIREQADVLETDVSEFAASRAAWTTSTTERPASPSGAPEEPVVANLPAISDLDNRLVGLIETNEGQPTIIGAELNLSPLMTEEFAADLSKAFYFLPREALQRIENRLARCPCDNGALLHLSGLRRIIEAEDTLEPRASGPSTALDRAIARHDFERAFALVAQSDCIPDMFLQTIEQASLWIGERFVAAALPIWLGLGEADRRTAAAALIRHAPRSVAAQAMLLAASEPEVSELADFVKSFDKASVYERDAVDLVCVSVGSPRITEIALARILKIGDVEDQTAAVVALMPYLPRDFPPAILASWRDDGMMGSRGGTLILVMEQLIHAIASGALADVLESSAKRESEWWLTEALTSTLQRLDKASEFEAMVEAALHIRALDLRARLLGRIARRAADFAHSATAIRAVAAIGEGPARWDAFTELAGHFALLGDFEAASSVAAMIPSSEERSRAYAMIAIELAAQARSDDAAAILKMQVPSARWQDFALALIANGGGSGHDGPRTPSSRAGARAIEPSPSSVELSISTVRESIGDCAPLASMLEALRIRDMAAVRMRAEMLWCQPMEEGMLLAELLASQHRPELLNKLAKLAPLLALSLPEAVIGTVRAIGASARSWR